MVLWFRRRNEAARLAEVNGRLHRQLEAQELSYQDTLHSFMDIKRIIHDINKQLVYIRACIEAGHAAEGADHINGILQEIEASCNTITTGNLAVDALVSHAINIASDLNIAMQHKVQLSGAPVDIERYDLCIVLGNLLDNAIDAARQVRLKHRTDPFSFISIRTTMPSLSILATPLPLPPAQQRHAAGPIQNFTESA